MSFLVVLVETQMALVYLVVQSSNLFPLKGRLYTPIWTGPPAVPLRSPDPRSLHECFRVKQPRGRL